jgi:hypothetical protein
MSVTSGSSVVLIVPLKYTVNSPRSSHITYHSHLMIGGKSRMDPIWYIYLPPGLRCEREMDYDQLGRIQWYPEESHVLIRSEDDPQ